MTGCEPTEVKCKCECHEDPNLQHEIGKSCCAKILKEPLTATVVSFVSEKLSEFYKLLRPELATMIQQQLYGIPHSNLEKRIDMLEKERCDCNNLHIQNQNRIDLDRDFLESIKKRIEALEKKPNRDSFIWGLLERIEQLEQERDKGVERLKKLEEAVQELITRNNEFLTDCKTMNQRQNAFSKHLNEKGLQYFNEWHEISKRLEALESDYPAPDDNILRSESSRLQNDTGSTIHSGKCANCNNTVEMGTIRIAPIQFPNHVEQPLEKVKTVSIYEAIKAYREGKKIRSISWEEEGYTDNSDKTCTAHYLDILADDWVIKDE
jgi:hypothetical protein